MVGWPWIVLAGAAVGIVGGLIGLGGAEFRLPLLIGMFGFAALDAVILNKATLTLSTGRIIPTRWVGEQHVKEDLGFIPSFADWVKAIRPEPWMGRAERIEARVDPHLAPPVVEVA